MILALWALLNISISTFIPPGERGTISNSKYELRVEVCSLSWKVTVEKEISPVPFSGILIAL